jgi:DNA-binding SARP family transcriptional activator
MEFHLLGPVRLRCERTAINVGVRKRRFVLAVLALEANHLVAVDRLIDLLWPDRPPTGARGVVHGHISGLRAVLAASGAARYGVSLRREGSGYLLACDPVNVDAHRFTELVRGATAERDLARRFSLLDEALGLWRGPALAGTAPEAVRDQLCRHLDETRLTALEHRLDALMGLDRYDEAISESTRLAAEQPERHRITELLMAALHRTGRSGEALAVYREAKRRIADELGLDPPAQLQQLELAILREDTIAPPAPADATATVPAQLPANVYALTDRVYALTDRTEALAQLDKLIPDAADRTPSVVISAIARTAGIENTALAVRWAPAANDKIRTHLADQLGLDPEAALQRLHQAILRGDSDAADAPAVLPVANPRRSAAAGVPRCLPRDIADFTGREHVLGELLAAVPDRTDAASAILTIDGMPGVGKTALAVHLAHRIASRYPDGQLTIDLHGHGQLAPVEVAAALDALLRQLGVAGDRIPNDLDARVALWRSELAGLRVLLLLDNAATSDQVAPLLPTGPGCLTLVTSRRRLTGLDAARPFSLDLLNPDEAVALITRVAGARAAHEPGAVAEVARRCGYLTLAIRLASARLAHRPSWSTADLATWLRTPTALMKIAAEGRTVIASFGFSYEHLTQAAQRMFRLLGLHPGPDIGTRAAGSLTDLDLDAADAVLSELVDAHLLDEHAAGRYRLHDLLREYARNLVDAVESRPEREAALERLFAYYLHTAAAAANLMEPTGVRFDYQLTDPPPLAILNHSWISAIDWYKAERANLIAAVRYAVDQGWHSRTARLTRATWRFLHNHGYHNDCITTHQLTIRSAVQTGDQPTLATTHNYLAGTYCKLGRWREAFSHLEQAIDLRTLIGDRLGQATSILNRGRILIRLGRYQEALESFDDGLAIFLAADAPANMIGDGYANIGLAHMLLGDCSAARTWFERHRDVSLSSNAPVQLATAHAHLGELELRCGRFREALDLLRRAAELRTANDDRAILAEIICNIGCAHRGMGRLDTATQHQLQALTITERQADPYCECQVRIELAATLHLRGHNKEAVEHLQRALDIAENWQIAPHRARALDGLANVLASTDPDQAHKLRNQADTIYQGLGLQRPSTVQTLDGTA